MQSNPLFESPLHIILKVPITLYYFSNTPLINHENILLEITCWWGCSSKKKKYQKHLLSFKLICFSLSHYRNDLWQRKRLGLGRTPTKQITYQYLKHKNHYKFNLQVSMVFTAMSKLLNWKPLMLNNSTQCSSILKSRT